LKAKTDKGGSGDSYGGGVVTFRPFDGSAWTICVWLQRMETMRVAKTNPMCITSSHFVTPFSSVSLLVFLSPLQGSRSN